MPKKKKTQKKSKAQKPPAKVKKTPAKDSNFYLAQIVSQLERVVCCLEARVRGKILKNFKAEADND